MKVNKLLEIIALIIFYLFLVWLIYQIILKLTGHSPAIETVLTTGMAMIMSFLFVSILKAGEFMGETKFFMNNAQESFKKIREDMNEMRKDISTMKTDIEKTKIKVKIH